MMRLDRSLHGPAIVLALALLVPAAVAAQAPPEAAAADPASAPKRKPPVKPKPQKPEPARPAAAAPRSESTPAALAPPEKLPELVVVCDAKAARYEDAKGFVIWVTRSGTITVENPLRPLTPETTRVLQVIIAARVATAYGPDLLALRRGNTPGALEAATGGPIRWDAELTVLPDPLVVVSELGETLAQLTFRECATAPKVKAPAAAAARKTPPRKAAAEKPAPAPAAKAPPGLQVPQGAIP